MTRGKFITFEGPDGSGKTTQIQLLFDYLSKKGFDCLLTREPGGTKVGEIMRDILKDTSLNSILSIETEVLLLQTARAQHVHELIKPSVEMGKIVLCDRYADSSVAYQGAGRGVGEKKIEDLNSFSTGNFQPDITFLLDVHPEHVFNRIDKRNGCEQRDRWEEQNIEFHRRVRNSFLNLAKKHSKRYTVINADRSIDVISADIQHIVNSVLDI